MPLDLTIFRSINSIFGYIITSRPRSRNGGLGSIWLCIGSPFGLAFLWRCAAYATDLPPHIAASWSAGAFLTLVGTLNTGSDWWNGLKRLDVGYGSNTIFANYWTGSSSNATTQSTQTAAAANTPISLEVARIGKQIVVFVNGAQAGSFADPGLFASGQVYLGVNVAPQNSMTM